MIFDLAHKKQLCPTGTKIVKISEEDYSAVVIYGRHTEAVIGRFYDKALAQYELDRFMHNNDSSETVDRPDSKRLADRLHTVRTQIIDYLMIQYSISGTDAQRICDQLWEDLPRHG